MIRRSIATLLLLVAMLGLGCATKPNKVRLPYEWPENTAITAMPASAPTANIASVLDTREDASIDMYLEEPFADTIRAIIAAELTQSRVFSSVAPRSISDATPAEFELGVVVEDASWMVPNYDRILKTAFWTSFMTGGIGGVAYGSSSTPVFGRAALSVTATRTSDRTIVFQQRVEAIHEEKMAKLSSDTLTTRLRMISIALKRTMEQLSAKMREDAESFTNKTPSAASGN